MVILESRRKADAAGRLVLRNAEPAQLILVLQQTLAKCVHFNVGGNPGAGLRDGRKDNLPNSAPSRGVHFCCMLAEEPMNVLEDVVHLLREIDSSSNPAHRGLRKQIGAREATLFQPNHGGSQKVARIAASTNRPGRPNVESVQLRGRLSCPWNTEGRSRPRPLQRLVRSRKDLPRGPWRLAPLGTRNFRALTEPPPKSR